jgi:hypothetical protein
MENEIRYEVNKDLYIYIPKNMKPKTFQGFFTFLRKSLQIKYKRRFHIDSLLKKCKGRFFKAINDCLRLCIKITIKRFPQSYITNISIEYNKQFLDFTLIDLYNYFNLLPYSIEVILEKDYYIKGKENFFKYILLSKVRNLYSEYIQSKGYKKEIDLIKRQKGSKIASLYEFVAQNFINYYSYSKPHIRKRKILGTRTNNNNNATVNNNRKNNINNNPLFNIKTFDDNNVTNIIINNDKDNRDNNIDEIK